MVYVKDVARKLSVNEEKQKGIKIIQKNFVDCIEILIDKMRYEKKLYLDIIELMNVRDSIKRKSFVDAYMKESKK